MADVNVHYDPITLQTDPTTVSVHADPTSVSLQGLDNIQQKISLDVPQPVKTELKLDIPQPLKTELKLDIPQPLKTEIKTELAVPEPIRTESSAAVDIKPLALDQCIHIRLGALPPTRIRVPYHQRFGLVLFGFEIIGFSFAGQTEIVTTEAQNNAQVAWGGVNALRPEKERGSQDDAGPLRVRLDG